MDSAATPLLGDFLFAQPWALVLAPLPWLWRLLSGVLSRRRRNRAVARRSNATGLGGHAARRSADDAQRSRPQDTAGAPPLPPTLGGALASIDARGGAGGDRVGQALRALAWFALLIALAQPQRPDDATVTPVSGRALALAIDLSGSMERDDFTLDGERADRLSVVQRVAGDFLARRAGDRVALVLFGKEAFLASPPTFDLASLSDALHGAGIGMAGRSTAIGDALGLAIGTLRDDPAPEKAVLLLSDGTNNAGSVEPEAAAALAARLGVRVHTIALGSDREAEGGYGTAPSADLDEATLERIAERAGGSFWRVRTSEALEAVYAAIDRLESAESPAPPARPLEELRRWALLALLVLLLVDLLREPVARRLRGKPFDMSAATARTQARTRATSQAGMPHGPSDPAAVSGR